MYAFVGVKQFWQAHRKRGVAQLVARSVRDAEVVGSNPVASTKKHGIAFRLSRVFFVYEPCGGVRGWEPFCGSKMLCLAESWRSK